ncbi:MAG: indolepyruvate oxidoreductase subunit beta [Anaerolineae bacterium]|nr:MAG: indolepyruvate oxidoreductase subunit beta [Anaerolineae bacterium]
MSGTKTHNILFAGVGGQGVLLAAEITALAAVHSGYDVKQTEVHGVSQRGGSVETHVRFGEKVWSPIVTPGKTDVIVGLEKLEALRFAHYAQPTTGVIMVNDHEIVPGSVKDADEIYPHDAIERMRQIGCVVLPMEASRVARDLGDGRMANVVMLGAMASFLPITEEVWLETLNRRLPEKYREPNLKAFTAGHALASVMEDRPSVRA